MKKRLALAVLGLFALGTVAHAALVTKWLLGTQTNLLTTELNSLSNNGYTVPGPNYNNIVGGGGGDGFTFCVIEFFGTFGANPTPNSGLAVWLLQAPDGANFEITPSATITQGRAPDVVLPVVQGQLITRVSRTIVCPSGLFRTAARNDGTGQSLAPSGNLVRIKPVTQQGVSQ
jgi:hypothetical protein